MFFDRGCDLSGNRAIGLGVIAIGLCIDNRFAFIGTQTDFKVQRDFAKERGYRICIDGLTHETLPFVDREKLGADMVKLIWNSDIIDNVGPKRAKRLIKRAGASKVIFCRCDEEAAVEFGQEIGVNMFQGRFIENLIAEESRRREMEMARRRTQNLDFLDEGGDE